MKRVILVTEDGTGGEEFTLCDQCASSFHESACCTIMETDAEECELCDLSGVDPSDAPRHEHKDSTAEEHMCFCNEDGPYAMK